MDEPRFKAITAPLGSLLRVLWDLLMLNLLWIITSVPIVTVGSAGSAVYSVLLRRDREGEIPVLRNYFRSFINGLLPASGLFFTAAALGAVAWVDFRFALTFEGTVKLVYMIIGCIIGLCCLIIALIAIPLQSRYNNTFRNHIKNAFALALVAPGQLLLLIAVWAVPVAVALLLPFETVIRIGIVYLLWGFSGPVYVSSVILNRLFARIQNKEMTDEQN